eukprot:CAMPEP_0119389036 /NCGR_PEP_ID=MMETSP1334-20130426/107458_1 /TAXON_ID=127549 /ORGANISM="Calcidiscus leptoporus, Strain RCC1130" /LENGTH=107 /DNA_ID=CAMNT_0007411171 /DNA_START=393 /DNA_END=712 /DNA_ORIENTATION=+
MQAEEPCGGAAVAPVLLQPAHRPVPLAVQRRMFRCRYAVRFSREGLGMQRMPQERAYSVSGAESADARHATAAHHPLVHETDIEWQLIAQRMEKPSAASAGSAGSAG